MIGELTIFNISLNSGTKHTTVAVIENQTTVVCVEDSDALVFDWTYNFTRNGAINLEIIITNDVSQASASLTIYKYYAINGISATNVSGVYNTNENIQVNFIIDSNAEKPQGSVWFNVTWGNGNLSEGTLDVETSSPESASHAYTLQGNYTVVLTLSSQVQSYNISYTVYVWDQLNVVLYSNPTAKINEIVSFEFNSPPYSNFRYLVTYGDGTTKENSDLDLYRLYDISPWTKSYSTAGEYNVTLTAWNPIYTTSMSYVVNVTGKFLLIILYMLLFICEKCPISQRNPVTLCLFDISTHKDLLICFNISTKTTPLCV